MKEMLLMQMAVDYPPTLSRNDELANEIRRDRLANSNTPSLLRRVQSILKVGHAALTPHTTPVVMTTQEIACATC